MNAKSKKDEKDQPLFVSLVKAHKANVAVVSVNADRLNRPGSPVWEPGENVAPILAMLMISVVCIFIINLLVGIAMIMLSAIIYLIFLRPWILHRVRRRALAAAMENLHNWDLLCKKGGLAVTLNDAKRSSCVSPAGDWRAFATRRFHKVKLDGEEIYDAFTRAEDNDAGLNSKDDMNM